MDPVPNRLLEIFSQVQTKASPAERERFLAEACRGEPELRKQVEALLGASERAGDFLAKTIKLQPPDLVTESPGTVIGHYKLLQQIGEGGCGVVYMAEQEEPIRRRVALKVIKLGMDTKQVIARFEAERQALALMDHPNIAKVLDAGATETGRPYFVMELVRGIRITDYCDQNNLSTEQRLDLFIQVCHAIQHAHQKGIIHRDIKPSNILVTINDGVPVPKVIDFGIAKATEQRLTDKTLFTAFEQFIGTPAYMSPEQAEMTSLDIDTRSDIYALGVLLYELLTGQTPFNAKELMAAGVEGMRRIIREQEPVRPSTCISTLIGADQTTVAKRRQSDPPKLVHQVRGDLDWIVMKCLEKDRTRRYETANGLANDIGHHLNSEPVTARPPSRLYKFQKLVRRNRLAGGAVCVVALALALGTAVSTWQAVRAVRAEGAQRRARQEAEQARSAETVERKKAEDTARQLAETFSVMEQKKLDEVLAKEGPSHGLAFLAQALRRNPNNYRAAYRLLSILSYQTVARLQSQRKFEGSILSTSYNSLGPLLITSPDQQSLWLWDYRRDRPLAGPLNHKQPLTAAESWPGPVQFSPSGQRFLMSLLGGTMEVWQTTNTVAPVCTFKSEVRPAKQEFSPDETRLLIGNVAEREFVFQVWDIITGKPLTKALRCERDSGLPTVRFADDGKTAAITYYSGSGTMVQRVLDIASGTLAPKQLLGSAPGTLRGNSIYCMEEEGACQLYLGERERRVLFPLATLKERRGYLEQPRVAVDARNLSADGTELLAAMNDGSAGMWDVGAHTFLPALLACPPGTSRIQGELAGDGRRLLTLDGGGTAGVWDVDTGRWLFTPVGDPGRVSLAFVSPGSESVVVALTNGWMRMWSLADGRPLTPGFRDGHLTRTYYETNRLMHLSFSRDGSRLAAAWSSGTAQVWDAREGKLVMEIAAHQGPARKCALDGDGKRLATVGEDRSARVWDVSTGTALTAPLKHSGAIASCEFSPDGLRLATASADKTARIWETQTGRNPLPPLKHEAEVKSARFVSAGANLVTGSGDGVIRVFDAATGATIKTIKTEGSHLVWPADERSVLVLNSEGGRMWDLVTATPLSEGMFKLAGSAGYYLEAGASLSRDGQRLAVNARSCLRIWELPNVKGPVPNWLPHLAESLAGQRLNEQDLYEPVAAGEFLDARQTVLAGRGNDAYQRWGEWFFTSSASAGLSPSSPISRESHLQACLDANTESSLLEGLDLAPRNARLLEAYLALTSRGLNLFEESASSANLVLWAQRAEDAAARLLELAPGSSVGWQVKGLALERLGRHQEALDALSHANPASPDATYWQTKAVVLEHLGRPEEALQAFTRAIEVARAKSQPVARHYLQRSRFFQRQGRLPEATEDACVARGIPKRASATPADLVDLSVSYTVPLTSLPLLDPGQAGGCELPPGVQTFGGVNFDVRGVVFFPPTAGTTPISIPVKSRCRGLHFLQAAYAYSLGDGQSCGKYTVRYADHRTEEIPLVLGRNIRDWWCYEGKPVDSVDAPLVWVGITKTKIEAPPPVFPCLYLMSWTNPLPDVEIVQLDLAPPDIPQPVRPVLFALTIAGASTATGTPPARPVFEQSLATLDGALTQQREQLGFTLAKAGLLERHGRGEEALGLVSKAIAEVEAGNGRATNRLAAAIRYRSALLGRLNSVEGTQQDRPRSGEPPAKNSRSTDSTTNTPGTR